MGLIAPQKALANFSCGSTYISQERNGSQCYYPGCIEGGGSVSIQIDNLTYGSKPFSGWVDFRDGGLLSTIVCRGVRFNNGKMNKPCNFALSELKIDNSNQFSVRLEYSGILASENQNANDFIDIAIGATVCKLSFVGQDSCDSNAGNQCLDKQAAEHLSTPFRICDQARSSGQAYDQCMDCVGDPASPKGVWTAIGCIPTNRDSIFKVLMQLGLGLGGGFALITILAASFQLSVSQGDPKQTGDAKDKITAAVIGLLFIIFSITILQFIGVKVLQIPGFGN